MTTPLGLESGVVRLVEYDDRWPTLFADEARRIRDVCAGLLLDLEHVGATAIPGMCAKPILDIAAGRPRTVNAGEYVAPLRSAGYEHRGEQGVVGREFFRRGQPRAYHIHLVEQGGEVWHRYLTFRDSLRADPDAARRYADLKRFLAARFPRDREAYIDGKGAFVEEILRRAMGAA